MILFFSSGHYIQKVVSDLGELKESLRITYEEISLMTHDK
jgi:hypothetical protein